MKDLLSVIDGLLAHFEALESENIITQQIGTLLSRNGGLPILSF